MSTDTKTTKAIIEEGVLKDELFYITINNKTIFYSEPKHRIDALTKLLQEVL